MDRNDMDERALQEPTQSGGLGQAESEKLLAQQREIIRLTEAMETARKMATDMEDRNWRLKGEVQALSLRLEKLQDSAQDIEADKKKWEERAEELQALLATTESNLRQRYAELDHVRRELEQLAEAAHSARAAEKRQHINNADLIAEIAQAHERILSLAAEVVPLRNDARQAREEAQGALKQLREQEALLIKARQDADAEIAVHVHHNADLMRNIALLDERHATQLRDLRIDTQSLQNRLDNQEQEYQFVSRQLFDEKRLAQATLEQQKWLLAVNQVLMEPGRWWVRFLPLSYRERMIGRRLARRELFDSVAYLSRYDDVARSGMNPLQHYIRHGMFEGRRTI